METPPSDARDEDPPTLSDREEEVLATAADRYPPDAPPERIDEEQIRQGRLKEVEKQWIDPREVVGGEE